MVRIRNRNIPLRAQLEKLRRYFPASTFSVGNYGNTFIWKALFQPSELSCSYEVKIEYILGTSPKVYVLSPNPLPLANGATRLPHVYNHKKQQLCLYYGAEREWTPDKMIADTILPWISEWLLHYEYWVITGMWHGGGIVH